ncbi:DDE-type integrase/transposase/recombinase [Bacillus cereus]
MALHLYRAIDQEGYTLDIQLRKTRDYQASYMFMKRLVKAFGEPTVLTTDKAPSLTCTFKIEKERFLRIRNIVPLSISIISSNKAIDISNDVLLNPQDFKNLRHASRNIKEIETIHAIYVEKEKSYFRDSSFSTYKELQELFRTFKILNYIL